MQQDIHMLWYKT